MSAEDRPKPRHVQRFQNEPNTDFSRAENRAEMKQALEDVAGDFGGDYPLNIDGKAQDTRTRIISRKPSDKETVVGTIASAGVDQAEQAIEAAQRAWAQWRKVPADHRAEYLELIATGIRNRRFELAAWIVCGRRSF